MKWNHCPYHINIAAIYQLLKEYETSVVGLWVIVILNVWRSVLVTIHQGYFDLFLWTCYDFLISCKYVLCYKILEGVYNTYIWDKSWNSEAHIFFCWCWDCYVYCFFLLIHGWFMLYIPLIVGTSLSKWSSIIVVVLIFADPKTNRH